MTMPKKLGLALLLTGLAMGLAFKNTHGDAQAAAATDAMPLPYPPPISSTPPVYPASAREKGIEGLVVLRVWTRDDGTVDRVKVIRSVPALDSSALSAVRTWRFPTTDSDGRPAKREFDVPVRYKLYPERTATATSKQRPKPMFRSKPDPFAPKPQVRSEPDPKEPAKPDAQTVAPWPDPRAPDANPDSLPKFGKYVYVEELPEAIHRIAPEYPDEAKRAGISGTVIVQCLVKKDGAVGETRIVKSIPALDAAAIAAVKQWRFKPALAKGEPVAVWVAVPVRFGS